MLTLYHDWLSPFCRKIRTALAEKKLEFALELEDIALRRPEFLAMNPACDMPVLVEDGGPVVSSSGAIAEYLEESFPNPPLYPGDAPGRAEIRRLIAWFDIKFDHEVTRNLLGEKVGKRMAGGESPDTMVMRAGRENFHIHLDYIAWLTERRHWLAGEVFSMADIAAGAHLSCLDYIGEVPWGDHEHAREWYARLKSRPSFRDILADRIPGMPPPEHYADPDF